MHITVIHVVLMFCVLNNHTILDQRARVLCDGPIQMNHANSFGQSLGIIAYLTTWFTS